jgi:transposase-like protein
MKSISQKFQMTANEYVRNLVEKSVQTGSISSTIDQELHRVISETLNQKLKLERDVFIGNKAYERSAGSVKRNGFRRRKIRGIFNGIDLRIPRVRKGAMELPLLQGLITAGRNLTEVFAKIFWLKGASTRSVSTILSETVGARLSPSQVSSLTNSLEPMIEEWEKRAISASIEYLFLDALYLPVRRNKHTGKEALLIALGITKEGKTKILGYLQGDRESNDSWGALIRSLIDRGLKISEIKLVVSDEHKAIESSVKNSLNVAHQFCLFHKIKNVRFRVAARDRKEFLTDLSAIFWAESREMAYEASGVLRTKWGKLYQRAVGLALDNFEKYIGFMDEPKNRWRALRTSNRIERFNRELRRRLNAAGAMQTELEVRKIVWSVSSAWEKSWEKRRAWIENEKKVD